MASTNDDTARVKQLIDGALRAALALGHAGGAPPTLQRAVQHAVFPGGARLRPRLCLAVAAACGNPRPATAAAAAASIELLHCASLVHDDLPCFDDAATRRGLPSVHAAFGEPLAVLAGDAMIVLAFENLAQSATDGCDVLAGLVALLSRAVGMAEGLCAGQAWESETDVDLAAYHRAKTGALFAAATEAGARSAADSRSGWADFGLRIGAAYQVADDLRDAVARESEVGKPVAQDARHQRPNAVLELGCRGALGRLHELIGDAVAAVPDCPGRVALVTQIEREARSFLPADMERRVA